MSAPAFVWSEAAIAAALGVPAPGAVQCTSVSTDTREIKPGALFVALKGERFDAHDFLAQAKERGAVAAVVRKDTPPTPG
ncbi:MAG TPA: Mur ligase domain-containing protein, partial [Gemmatimonadales bacterium]|nr:Mur ligase domain-containing protein [Gemmatimonadales bacterium]